ncbi:hypothetical protein MRX96_013293 [Rhipicephalus microplus]
MRGVSAGARTSADPTVSRRRRRERPARAGTSSVAVRSRGRKFVTGRPSVKAGLRGVGGGGRKRPPAYVTYAPRLSREGLTAAESYAL